MVRFRNQSGDISQACKRVDAIDPALYPGEDVTDDQTVFEKLAAREAVTVSFYFQTVISSSTGYLVTSHGDGTATVSTWDSCDNVPISIVSEGAALGAPAALTACAGETDDLARIACIADAFTIDGSAAQCQVPGGHIGPP